MAKWYCCTKCEIVASYAIDDMTGQTTFPRGEYLAHQEFITTGFNMAEEANQYLAAELKLSKQAGVKRLKMTLNKTQKLKMCSGCEDDFYNGNNPLGVKECWLLKKARLVKKKKVHINQRPPWNQAAIKVLSCYHQKGYVFVGPNQEY